MEKLMLKSSSSSSSSSLRNPTSHAINPALLCTLSGSLSKEKNEESTTPPQKKTTKKQKKNCAPSPLEIRTPLAKAICARVISGSYINLLYYWVDDHPMNPTRSQLVPAAFLPRRDPSVNKLLRGKR